MPDASPASPSVERLVGEVKRRWRRRTLMRGAALTLLALLAGAAVLAVLRGVFGAGVPLLAVAGAVGVAVAGWIFLKHVARPGLRPISDREVALYVEERVPELEDRLNSAIEVGALSAAEHDALLDRLIRDAAQRAEAIPAGALVNPEHARRLLYGAAAAALVLLAASYLSWDALRLPAGASVAAGDAPAQGPAPRIQVAPGHAEVEQGSAQPVTATLREAAEGEEVVLHYRTAGGRWREQVMQKTEDGTYRHEFSSVQEPVQYAAAAGTARTDTFALSLYDFPKVRQVDLTYEYPAYTRQPERTEENAREIRGLEGSTVTLDVETSATAQKATLVLNGGSDGNGGNGERISLERAGAGQFRGQLPLRASGTYRLRLTDAAGKENKFPEEHEITAVEDQPPRVALRAPRRDVRAHPVQEVEVAAEAEDDYGLKRAEIRYTVNDGEEQAVPLTEAGEERLETAAGAHRFFLEEIEGLEPGDLISYYVEAEDYAPGATPAATDLYFVEVVPFETRFSQANNQGGGGGGGQQQSGPVLSQQEIINATWKLRRQRAGMTEGAFEEALGELRQAQRNLKADVEERISKTAFSVELRADKKSQQVVEYLRAAAGHMDEALRRLQPERLEDALPPERKALRQLLKADAQNKERRVAMQRQQQGGGGGGSSSATEQRMTELADLELDISKDKYETQQQRASAAQGGGGGAGQQLQKAKELARKQEELMRQEQPELRGEDKKRQVERLRRQQEELQQQTRSLARAMRQRSQQEAQQEQQSSSRTRASSSSSGQQRSQQQQQRQRQRAQQAQRRMERASQQMDEAQRALRRDNPEEAREHQREALRTLDQLQNDLRMNREGGVRQAIDEMEATHRQLEEKQRQLARATRGMEEGSEGTAQQQSAATDSLEAEQGRQLRRLRQLKSQAEAAEQRAQEEGRSGVASAAGALRRRVEDEALEEKMESAQQALRQGRAEAARQEQEAVQEGLGRLSPSLQELKARRPASGQEKLARTLEKVQEMKRRLRAAQEQQQASQGGNPQGSSPQQQALRDEMRRQLQEAGEALRGMEGRRPEGNARLQRGIDAAASALRADHTGEELSGDAARDYFDGEAYEQLSALEEELARELEGVELEERIYDARPEDAPSSYRDLVEEYYESLSKSDGGQ